MMLDVVDKRPVDDILWFDEDYRVSFERAGLELVGSYKPLGRTDEPFKWVNGTRIAPWIVYVVRRASRTQ